LVRTISRGRSTSMGSSGTTSFAVALFLGMLRQVWSLLLSHAAALPVIDQRGRLRFAYIGDVPPQKWCHSPWFRAGTWTAVCAASLTGAAIVSVWLAPLLAVPFATTVVGCLTIRWLLTWIPIRLYLAKQFGSSKLRVDPVSKAS